jgi:hypothetical protein
MLFYVLLSGYFPFDELDLITLYRKAHAIIISTIFHDYYTMLCYKLQHFFFKFLLFMRVLVKCSLYLLIFIKFLKIECEPDCACLLSLNYIYYYRTPGIEHVEATSIYFMKWEILIGKLRYFITYLCLVMM